MVESREALVSGTPAEGTGELERELSFDAGSRMREGFGDGLGEVALTFDALAMRLRSAEPREGAVLCVE